jgi:dTDP-4-dehydrorhamnose 3,5-epimerase-like enzyme
MINKIWKEPFDSLELARHTDERGFLFEILRFMDLNIPGEGQLYTFSINPGKRRGDHFHHKKREWFTCVSGKATVLLSHQNGNKQAFQLSSDYPTVVYAGAGTAHALTNKFNDTAVIVSYGSTQHEVDDNDTFYQIAYENYIEGDN